MCEDELYIQVAACNEVNPPGPIETHTAVIDALVVTGSMDWAWWLLGGVLLIGAGIVVLNLSRPKWNKNE